MSDNEDFDRDSRPGQLRPARNSEPSFYGGPLDGSFDFVPPQDDMLEWQWRASKLIHVYERDITGRMCYLGLKQPDYPGGPE